MPSDQELRSILGDARTIAVVGLSTNPERPSYEVAEFLQSKGYRIVPVNPNATEVLGERAYASLLEVPEEIAIDVVDVFRRAEHTPEVAEQAVARGAKVLWLQEGIANDDARRIGEDAGLTVDHGRVHQEAGAETREGFVMQKWEYFVAPLLEHNPGEILEHVRRGRVGARVGGADPEPDGRSVARRVHEAPEGLASQQSAPHQEQPADQHAGDQDPADRHDPALRLLLLRPHGRRGGDALDLGRLPVQRARGHLARGRDGPGEAGRRRTSCAWAVDGTSATTRTTSGSSLRITSRV